jgi:hypothetical protein
MKQLFGLERGVLTAVSINIMIIWGGFGVHLTAIPASSGRGLIEVVTRNLCGGTEESNDTPQTRIAGDPDEIRNEHFP